ncbi:MAG: hypothetical protein ACRD1R_08130, partial [Acidobacteriota bacterium]
MSRDTDVANGRFADTLTLSHRSATPMRHPWRLALQVSITKVIPHPLYHGNVPILIVNIISSLLFWAFLPAQTFRKHS